MFYHAAKNFWLGKSIYTPTPWSQYYFPQAFSSRQIQQMTSVSSNVNPPVFSLILLPLGFLKESVATALWDFFALFSGFGAVWLVYKVFLSRFHETWNYFLLLAIFLAPLPFYANILLGQTGSIITFSVFGVWFLARKKHDVLAGFLLGLILSVKFFFGLLAILFLLQKRWKFLSAMMVSFLLLNGLSLALFGKETFVQYVSILHHISWYASNWNASLYGLFIKFFPENRLLRSTLYELCSIFLVCYQVKLCYKEWTSTEKFDFAFSYTLIISILISPLGWVYYLPVMILPIMLMIEKFSSIPAKDIGLPLILTFTFALGLLCFPMKMGFIHEGGWLNVYFISACYCYALLLFLGLLIYTLRLSIATEGVIFPWVILTLLIVMPSFGMFLYWLR